MSMSLAPQLAFNGHCRPAFDYYAKLLGGKVTVMNSFGQHADAELPPGSIEGPADHIRFAEVTFDSGILRGNDVQNEQFAPMSGFNVSLHFESAPEAKRIFSGLSEGGRVTTPLTKVAWAKLFGMVVDRFGVPWLVLVLSDWSNEQDEDDVRRQREARPEANLALLRAIASRLHHALTMGKRRTHGRGVVMPQALRR